MIAQQNPGLLLSTIHPITSNCKCTIASQTRQDVKVLASRRVYKQIRETVIVSRAHLFSLTFSYKIKLSVLVISCVLVRSAKLFRTNEKFNEIFCRDTSTSWQKETLHVSLTSRPTLHYTHFRRRCCCMFVSARSHNHKMSLLLARAELH